MMIHGGSSSPQQVTLTGTVFPTGAIVLVTPPGSDATIPVTPISVSATVIVFAFVFAVSGAYQIAVADEDGLCDLCASATVTMTLTAAAATDPCAPVTLGDLRRAVQHRLGDDGAAIWSVDELNGYLREGYRTIATELALFWDQAYAENLPRGFSVTQPWELAFLDHSGGFAYGVGNFTAEFERRALGDERLRYGPANHTSPFEATDGLLVRAHASTAIPATSDLSPLLTQLDRVSWDNRTIEALEPRSYSKLDARYEITTGEVYGYMWQKDGVRTLRKVRVPAVQAQTVSVTGTWGLLRTPSDLSTATQTGTWGIARVIAGQHPLGPETFGAPRRPYLEGTNVRVEHFRQGRVLATDDTACELPTRYALYLRDFAQARSLSRPGPGYDQALADHFLERWVRGLARIAKRVAMVDTEHVTVMGGDGQASTTRPPRPSMPWAYGSRVR